MYGIYLVKVVSVLSNYCNKIYLTFGWAKNPHEISFCLLPRSNGIFRWILPIGRERERESWRMNREEVLTLLPYTQSLILFFINSIEFLLFPISCSLKMNFSFSMYIVGEMFHNQAQIHPTFQSISSFSTPSVWFSSFVWCFAASHLQIPFHTQNTNSKQKLFDFRIVNVLTGNFNIRKYVNIVKTNL